MTPQEMHIDFDIKYQRSNNNVHGTILPEEKDWWLNQAVNRYIKSRFDSSADIKQIGFEGTQKRFDDIRALLKNVDLPAFISDNDVKVFCTLPYDYMYLVEDNSIVYNSCENWSTYSKKIGTSVFYKTIVPLVDDADLYENYILRFYGTSGTEDIYDVTDTKVVTPFTGLEEKFILINSILDVVNKLSNYKIYWEYFEDTYSPNSFIIITKENGEFTYEIKTGELNTPIEAVEIKRTSYNVPTDLTKYISPNRLTSTEDIQNVLNHSFYTTNFKSPISTLFNRILYVYHLKKFIVTGINISYIRQPNKISITLNTSCDLAESTHAEIVDIAVQLVAAYKNSTTYQNIKTENLLNE